jgi:hypothetical protein
MATFGKTTIGATATSYSGYIYAGCKRVVSEGGTITSISLYCNAAGNARVAVYTDNAGSPDVLVVESADEACAGGAWHDFGVPDTAFEAGTYWLCFQVTVSAMCKYDAATGGEKYRTYTYGAYPNPFGTVGGTQDRDYSIYATYTPSGILKTVTDSLSLSDAVLRNKPLLSITDSLGVADSVKRDKTFAITDVLGLADSVLGNKNPLIVSDTVSLADLIDVITGAIIKTVLDSVGLADQVLANKSMAVADTVSILDMVFRHKPSITVSDVVSAIEAVLVAKLLAVADSVSLVDVARVLKTLNVSDTLTLVDAASTPSRVLQTLDSVGLADNIIINKVLQIAETINLVEIIQVGVGGAKKTKLFLILGDMAVQLTGE